MRRLRPSGSYMWTHCAAYPAFIENVPPEPDSDPAREGTCAAWVADCVLRGDAASCEDMLDRTHKNGWLVTPDMVTYVQGYVDLVLSRGGEVSAEEFVVLTDTIGGSLDSSTILSSGTCLFIDDLKYGYGIVNPYRNTQLTIYAAGKMKQLGFPAHITHVQLGIYQPRAFHHDGIYRTWLITVQELYEFATWIIGQGDKCQSPNPVATPGEHCEHCPAANTCQALIHSVYRMSRHVTEDTRQRQMTAEELAKELDFMDVFEKMMKSRRTALDAEAESRIKGGEYVKGWGFKERLGNRKFKYDPKVIQLLTGMSPMKSVPMTPAEFERGGADIKTVKQLTERPIIGHALEKFTGSKIAKVFGDKE